MTSLRLLPSPFNHLIMRPSTCEFLFPPPDLRMLSNESNYEAAECGYPCTLLWLLKSQISGYVLVFKLVDVM